MWRAKRNLGEGLSGVPAMFIIGSSMATVIIGSTIPSGLYTIYQRQWGLSVAIMTAVFAIYVLGVLVGLLGFGHLSDYLGRKPIMLSSLVLSLVSSLFFIGAGGVMLLCVGRLLSGLSVGMCTGAFTAALREYSQRATTGSVVSTSITSGALAIGPLFSGLAAAWSTAPLQVPYYCYMALAMVCVVGVVLVAETRQRVAKVAWIRLKLGVPTSIMPIFIASSLALSCAYAGNGLFQSVIPMVAGGLFRQSDLLVAAYPTVMLGTSAVAQVLALRIESRWCTKVGLGILAGGFVVIALAVFVHLPGLFMASSVIVGIGNGLAFRGSLARVATAAPADSGAQIISSYYVIGYVATAAPTLLAGAVPSLLPEVVLVLAGISIVTMMLRGLRR